MTDYCTNNTLLFYEWHGKIVPIDKTKIKTHFCFGYSYTDDGQSFNNAQDMCAHAGKSERYFMKQNHDEAGYNRKIRYLNDAIKNKRYKIFAAQNYGEGNIYYIGKTDSWNDIPEGATELTPEEICEYKKLLAEACKLHHKKIVSYLKKYGLSKLEIWSYWRDA